MSVRMMPTMATITKKNEMDKEKNYMKVCVVIDNQFFWCVLFGNVANYIDSYANIGAQIFIEEWNLNKSENYYDFHIARTKIIKNGEVK